MICDVDNTVYQRSPEYFTYGTHSEISAIAEILGLTFAQTESLIKETKTTLVHRLSRVVALTEVVLCLGVTLNQWNSLRHKAWCPLNWVRFDPIVAEIYRRLGGHHHIHFGTNNPSLIGERIINLVGIRSVLPEAQVYGPDNLGFSKPDFKYFGAIAKKLGVNPARCISLGDREFSEGPPAIQAGYAGAIIFPGGRDELVEALPNVFNLNATFCELRKEVRNA